MAVVVHRQTTATFVRNRSLIVTPFSDEAINKLSSSHHIFSLHEPCSSCMSSPRPPASPSLPALSSVPLCCSPDRPPFTGVGNELHRNILNKVVRKPEGRTEEAGKLLQKLLAKSQRVRPTAKQVRLRNDESFNSVSCHVDYANVN